MTDAVMSAATIPGQISKHSTKPCCPRPATAHLDRANADQRAERRQGRGVFVDLNKHDTVSPSRADQVNRTNTVRVEFLI